MNNKRNLYLSYFLSAAAVVLFLFIIFFMRKISISNTFEVQGKISSQDNKPLLQFDALESDFNGYEKNETIIIKNKKDQKNDAIILEKELVDSVELKYGKIYHYEVLIDIDYDDFNTSSNDVFYVKSKDKQSFYDIISRNFS